MHRQRAGSAGGAKDSRGRAGHQRLDGLGLCLLALLAAIACESRSAVTTLRLGHGLPVSHPVHRAMEHMAERAAERSSGRLRMVLYPAEQLGSERECLELLQIGSLAMTKVSASVMENFAPGFRVFGTPYLFRDESHRVAALEGEVGRELLLESQRYRLRGLAWYDAGQRSFYTRDRPVRTPADLEGMKIRTQESASAMALVRQLGAAATPIAWGELYTALQQGVVDGAENNPPSFHLSGHYEVARYYTLDEHTAVPDVLLIGTPAWERLNDEERGWLEAAVADSVIRQRELWREATREALRAVREAGVEVIVPDKALFARAAAGSGDGPDDDPELTALARRIRAVQP